MGHRGEGMETILIVGGARSGKSHRALEVARDMAPDRVFIATAEPSDSEMAERIERHRVDRGSGFSTVEAPLELVEALEAAASPDRVVVVDCLTLWLSNLMHYGRDVDAQTAALTRFLARSPGPVILVSNEVGMGLVPGTPIGRGFRDAQGSLNQAAAAVCGRVELMVAALPMKLKG